MKFSETWLREWVQPAVNTATLVEQLTMAGLEVDAVEAVAGNFSGVVVGEIVAREPHPDADKLSVCQVFNGQTTVQVVCGAPNAVVGLKAPFAQVGAVLPNDFRINKAKLRGVESCGMLCGASELGMEDLLDGLMELSPDATVGQDLRDYLALNDTIIEVDLTPNRGDCLGMLGLAREVAVLNKCDLTEPVIETVAATIDDTLPIMISAEADCPRYVGRVIRNVNINAETPLWMKEKLRRSGIRSIDAVVDVTNYILLELGQPMHAFDLEQLRGGIRVRHASAGETLQLLDEQQLNLQADSLVIADEQRALALAGIMGGAASGVSEQTRHLFLEAAFFSPERIAGRARSFGLHTDSSHRFERGVDYEMPLRAMQRATALLLDIVGGEAGPVSEVTIAAALPQKVPIQLRRQRIRRTLGMEIADGEVVDTLRRLGMTVSDSSEGWQVSVPSYRYDIAIEADLMEELARIYGYNRLPVNALQDGVSLRGQPEAQIGLSALRSILTTRAYQEAISYSFVDPALQRLIDPAVQPVAVKNPISSDMAVMRTSLWPGLLGAMEHNLKRQQARVRLFECGQSFVPTEDELLQRPRIAGLITGNRYAESWASKAEHLDFFDLKGDVEALLACTAAQDPADIHFEPAEHAALHPGQCAEVFRSGQSIGVIGALHPKIRSSLSGQAGIYLFDLDLAALTKRNVPQFKELSKFPEVRRDLAIIVNQEVQSSALTACIRQAAGAFLKNLVIFDVYQGQGIDLYSKSLAFGLTYQHPSRTLTEEEINASVDTVVAALKDAFDASLRN